MELDELPEAWRPRVAQPVDRVLVAPPNKPDRVISWCRWCGEVISCSVAEDWVHRRTGEARCG